MIRFIIIFFSILAVFILLCAAWMLNKITGKDIYLAFGVLLITVSSFGQITLNKDQVILKADTMEVSEAFRLLNYMVPKGQKITKIVYKDGKEYYQSKWLINRMLKRYAYTERNGKIKLVRIDYL